jgi:CRP-like cAMP-binding protein
MKRAHAPRRVPRPQALAAGRRRAAARGFDVQKFLETAGVARRVVTVPEGTVIYSQGDPCNAVMYIQSGSVKLSVVSHAGKEAVVAVLGPGEFFGEGALMDQPVRIGAATAFAPTTMLVVQQRQMRRMLHEHRDLANRFIAYLLARNLRIEADLVDQLFNTSERRLARSLLLLARFGKPGKAQRELPRLSQETLAEMVGTTRSRVNFFMNKFRRLGFIEYNGVLKINDSLLSVILRG